MTDSFDRPAILGGEPLFPQGSPDWPGAWDEVARSVQRSLSDGSWGKYCGPNHERLESRLCEFFQVEHVILCASGTAAVELALRGAKVGSGDQVLLAGYDFKANFQNILTVGATPILSDVQTADCQLDVSQIMAGASDKSRAVIASHLHGGLVDLPRLMAWAESRGLTVIEDACQCPGAMLAGRRAGTIGDVGVLSFGGSKLLSAGRGGAVLTNRPEIAQRIRLHTQRGNEAYPLSELQAAALLPQLDCLDDFNQQRLHTVNELRDQLPRGLSLLASKNDDTPAFYKVGLLYDPAEFSGLSRDAFSNALRAEGIAIDAGFRALHLIHSRRRFETLGPLPHSERADTEMLVLHHPVLRASGDFTTRFVAAVERIRLTASEIHSSGASRRC